MPGDKIARFHDSKSFFSCPVCHQDLKLIQKSLVCKNKHCYDISKYGYVNLLMSVKNDANYNKVSFENRRNILEDGFYSEILLKILAMVQEMQDVQNILDVGCGEGYYSRKLLEKTQKNVLAFDISKESIQIAARNDKENKGKWFVSDLAKLPIQDKTIDCILDIFSPANYSEFHRVLKDSGYIIKVVPTTQHLQEIREKAREHLRNKSYTNEKVLDYFRQHCTVIKEETVTTTYSVTPEQKAAFLEMTPLLFNIDKEKINWEDITTLTISAVVLLGQMK